MLKTPEQLADEFLAKIQAAMDKHAKAYSKDARWHQLIVIVSGACGLLSLAAGSAGQALLAGVLGGFTTMGSVLTQTLHCVKAQGWQDRMRAELDGIRLQFVYEHGSAPTPDALAGLSKQFRDLQSKMSKEWERTLSSQSGGLNVRLPKPKSLGDA
ncbi:hypothetical protein [Bradyrhizobium sp. CCBAU 53421]|uniref:hypothetical protein n=1 Tax=Bradyrhizobium sp. CCBAU 53421 TaxID=1325120 RepID=UPI00188BBD62|nr:hypothetical protein [Bradyrhizobium sp. CCBAU 53421]QOZ33259.1 hypothetical protein XH92_17595 [Bradyrhizobium sp. CCBAU 53421]